MTSTNVPTGKCPAGQSGFTPKQAFDEGEVAPTGSYAFELDLSGQSGCDIIEQIVWMIEPLESPY